MKSIAGGNLRDSHDMTVQDKFGIMGGMTQAVTILHNLGYVHDDLKPENFILNGRTVVLIDFEGTWSRTPTANFGTKRYNAPERRDGEWGRNVSNDLCSLGVIFVELVDGPLDLFPTLVKDGESIPLSKTPDCLRPLILKLLSLDQNARGNANDFVRSLEAGLTAQ
jgi:serine/threonine protein kinase